MEARVLGPLEVVGPGGARIKLTSQPQRRLASLLIMRANTVVAGEVLGEQLGLSAGAVRTSVSRLRRLIGVDALVTAPPGYELRTDCIDAVRFEQLLARARSSDLASARRLLEEALGLWRGQAYAEFAPEEWAHAEVARLTELQVAAVEELADVLIDAGEHSAAIAVVEPAIEAHPFRDRLRALLLHSLARSGRQIEALRHFQSYRKLLVEEVGAEPSPYLVKLDRAIALGTEGDLDRVPPEPVRRKPSVRPDVRSSAAFLFTDVVGSTRLWAQHTEAMAIDLAEHDRIVRAAIGEHRGTAFAAAGDSFAAMFDSVDDAIAAAVDAQVSLGAAIWKVDEGIAVRMAVHVGEAERRAESWYGPPLNETARMMALGHGGQILVSEAGAALLTSARLIDLGDHRLRDVDGVRRVFQVTAPTLRADLPPLRSMGGYKTTLPPQRTSFVGRAELLAELHAMVAARPLVTLLGPGGSGKTRLAIEAAGRDLPHFPDGVFFVDLTTATDETEVVNAMLSGLDLSVVPEQPPEEGLADHLRDRAALLVVDNCEHVMERAAALVDDLLRAAPGLRVLATSREALGLDGEQCVPVPPLETDGPDAAAVRLFAERTLDSDPSATLDGPTLATVAEVTRRLDGIPLAIELAAARMRSLSPDQILDHLDERFRLLRSDHRRVAPRQQTLEAAIDWSYGLLDDDERRSFRHLAMCAGSFTLPIACGVLGLDELDAAEQLESLVSKSLVTPVRLGGTSRGYRLLESIRVFGLDRLAAADEVAGARAALQRAVLPPPDHADDWTWLVNEYMTETGDAGFLEDTTRREAARYAHEQGQFDVAALIYSSCAFRDVPGIPETVLPIVRPLAGRGDDLGPTAWRAANAALVNLSRLTRRYDACFDTAARMLAHLGPDDPARPWFESWRVALTIAVAPEAGLRSVDDVVAGAVRHARPGHDLTLSQILTSKATGLAMVRDLDEAISTAQQAVEWARPGSPVRDQPLGSLLWLLVVTGRSPDRWVTEAVAGQAQAEGNAQFCAAPAAVCTDEAIDVRAAELVRLARRRPLSDVATPYLIAFAWLAIECGDRERARALAAVAELYDSSTELALLHLLARLEEWPDDRWTERRDAAIASYLSPDHAVVAERGAEVLEAELDRWSVPA